MIVKTINTKRTDGTETYQQDRIYDTSGISPALARGKSDINIIQIGNVAESEGWDNPQCGRVYDISGISPTLNTCGGGVMNLKC